MKQKGFVYCVCLGLLIIVLFALNRSSCWSHDCHKPSRPPFVAVPLPSVA